MDHKTKQGHASYLTSRKSMLDAYNVAAATNPGACKTRVIDETKPAPPKRRSPKPSANR